MQGKALFQHGVMGEAGLRRGDDFIREKRGSVLGPQDSQMAVYICTGPKRLPGAQDQQNAVALVKEEIEA